jgi:mRNA interferase MazF
VFSHGEGISTQVAVGVDDGLKHESWIVCDNLRSLRKPELTQFLGRLSRARLAEVDKALKIALELEWRTRPQPIPNYSFSKNSQAEHEI